MKCSLFIRITWFIPEAFLSFLSMKLCSSSHDLSFVFKILSRDHGFLRTGWRRSWVIHPVVYSDSCLRQKNSAEYFHPFRDISADKTSVLQFYHISPLSERLKFTFKDQQRFILKQRKLLLKDIYWKRMFFRHPWREIDSF